jgi:hypothetical protein
VKPPGGLDQAQIDRVEALIAGGEKVYRACRRAGVTTTAWYITKKGDSLRSDLATAKELLRESLAAPRSPICWLTLANRIREFLDT